MRSDKTVTLESEGFDMSANQVDAADSASLSPPHPTHVDAPRRSPPRTRTSAAWAGTTGGLVVLILLVVVMLQNLESVDVRFISLHAQLPLAVLLLLVAVLGALIVSAFGAARVVQLRVQARRARRQS